MFDNYFNLQKPEYNNEDLNDLLFKQLIVESFLDNEERFDNILSKLNNDNVSLFEKFTIYPEYAASGSNNEIIVERSGSDYNSFLNASVYFIKNEKYIIKLINNIKKEELDYTTKKTNVILNQENMTSFIMGLLDNNFENSLKKIIENKLLTEKEIKLKLILPENIYYYNNRKIKFHTLEVDFLSKHIHELKITKRNSHQLNQIYKDVLDKVDTKQYENIIESTNKLDFSMIDDFLKKDIFRTLLEYGIIQPEQIIGEKNLIKNPKIEIKSFLFLSSSSIGSIIEKQKYHLEKRLNISNNNVKEKLRKI